MSEDLIAFVTARLDEDAAPVEAKVCGCLDTNHWPPCTPQPWRDRPRREIAAKRARLALMTEAQAEMDASLSDKHAGDVGRAMKIGRARGATVAVKWDATVWSDHPDYRTRWKP